MDFISTIKPENELEKQIITDAEWAQGAFWGLPREGHPEGKNIEHILEVFGNIDKLNVFPEVRSKLRLIALIHDTFKYKVDVTRNRVGENNHAVLARKFAEKYIQDEALLKMIELHDEASNSWKKGNDAGEWDKAEERLRILFGELGENIALYHLFYRCDNETGDKDQECLRWFEVALKI